MRAPWCRAGGRGFEVRHFKRKPGLVQSGEGERLIGAIRKRELTTLYPSGFCVLLAHRDDDATQVLEGEKSKHFKAVKGKVSEKKPKTL
uniref:Uncharacterized protein n=1 Tax=Physcomitrium patens TaxID=3218 RepID=A0A2K1INQ5_PHYPA|nr:hypothetical protein PHYPA_027220 [Physcomitrium patens]